MTATSKGQYHPLSPSMHTPLNQITIDSIERLSHLQEVCMLVLRRTAGEQLVIAGAIRITILQIQGNGVKIGIEAPSDISILRGELVPPQHHPGKRSAESQDARVTESCPVHPRS